MYFTWYFLAQLSSEELPWVVIAVINVCSSKRISIYGDSSSGAEHQALSLSIRANEGARSSLFEEDAVMLSSGILRLSIPRLLLQLSTNTGFKQYMWKKKLILINNVTIKNIILAPFVMKLCELRLPLCKNYCGSRQIINSTEVTDSSLLCCRQCI